MSRFEPENNPYRVAAVYRHGPGDIPFVILAGPTYARAFACSFTEKADPRIVFPGPAYGRGCRELLSHVLAHIHTKELGPTHPALVEAMGYGNVLIVNDTPENREVAGEAATYFRIAASGSLAAALNQAVEGERNLKALRLNSRQRAKQKFSWDRVTDLYEDLLTRLARDD